MELLGPSAGGYYAGLAAGLVTVRVFDQRGNPLPDVPVTATASAGGSVRPLTKVTRHDGYQHVLWRLAADTTAYQTITLTAGPNLIASTSVRAVSPPFTDLAVYRASAIPPPPTQEAWNWVEYEICSCLAGGAVGVWADVSVHLSRDRMLSADDLIVSPRNEHVLAANNRRTLQVGIRKDSAVGDFYVIVAVNVGANAIIPESKWDNNWSATTSTQRFGH